MTDNTDGERAQPPSPSRESKPPLITDARIIRMPRDDKSTPALIYAAESAPSKGSKIMVKLANGVTYVGTVLDATQSDGEVLVELRDGLAPA